MEGARGRGRSRKTWEQCVRDDMKLLGLHSEWAIFRDMWRDLIWGKGPTFSKYMMMSDDDEQIPQQSKKTDFLPREWLNNN